MIKTRAVLVTAAAFLLTAGVAGCKPATSDSSATTAPSSPATAAAASPTVTTATTAAKPSATSAAATASASVAAQGLTSATFSKNVPAIPKIVSVREDGPLDQNARVAGRDAGQSTRYGNSSVWFFADTTLKNPFGFLSNSAAVTTNLNASSGLDLRSSNGFTVANTATPVEVIPRTAAESAFEKQHAAPAAGCAKSTDQYCGVQFSFWPGATFADPARHRVIFMYSKQCRATRAGTPCAGGIGKGLGNGFAALDMTNGKVTRLTMTGAATVKSIEGADPTLFFGSGDAASIGGNAALVVDSSVYLYGKCDYFDCAVAKVPLAGFSDRTQWRYYDGSGFAADAGKAAKTGATSGGSGNSVFYDAALKAYVDVYMPWGYDTIWFKVGGSPYGPWSAATKLITTKGDTAKPNYSTYAHPEFAEKNGWCNTSATTTRPRACRA